MPSEYDFSICGFGSIGKICDYDNQYCKQIYFIIHDKTFKDIILEVINKADWRSLYKMTASPNLSYWMINKYLKEQITQLNYKE